MTTANRPTREEIAEERERRRGRMQVAQYIGRWLDEIDEAVANDLSEALALLGELAEDGHGTPVGLLERMNALLARHRETPAPDGPGGTR